MPSRRLFVPLLPIIWLLLLPALCGTAAAEPRAAQPGRIAATAAIAATAVRVTAEGGMTNLVIDLLAPVDVTAAALAAPLRMTVDLPDVVFAAGAGNGSGGNGGAVKAGLVTSFRFGTLIAGRSRVVLDLAAPARVARITTGTGPAGTRLVVSLEPCSAAEFEIAARAREGRPTEDRTGAIGRSGAVADARPLVVIDPGHGGVDPGANAGKEVEKSIVLQFGLLLRDKLRRAGLRVDMTREDDSFVSLGDRVRFSRERNASLLVSIHADTLAEGEGVRGATVYTNAERASDERSARLAEKENRADQAAGVDGSEDRTDIADILFDLTRRETRALSGQFAQALVTNLQRTVRTNKNPLRSAGFRVLRSPDTPSILLELGYLSSADDMKLLISEEWREAATTAVADSIARHLGTRGERGAATPAAP